MAAHPIPDRQPACVSISYTPSTMVSIEDAPKLPRGERIEMARCYATLQVQWSRYNGQVRLVRSQLVWGSQQKVWSGNWGKRSYWKIFSRVLNAQVNVVERTTSEQRREMLGRVWTAQSIKKMRQCRREGEVGMEGCLDGSVWLPVPLTAHRILTPAPGDPTPSAGLCWHNTHMHTYTDTSIYT